MNYNSNKHNRISIRLKDYDYSQRGIYFITIICHDRISRFGEIINGEMILNQFGNIGYNEWLNLSERFSNFEMDVFQIMPDHIHAIISLKNTDITTIGDIVSAFKSITLNKCLEIYKSKNEIMGKLWQRNYYERIITDETAYNNIAKYIIDNPKRA